MERHCLHYRWYWWCTGSNNNQWWGGSENTIQQSTVRRYRKHYTTINDDGCKHSRVHDWLWYGQSDTTANGNGCKWNQKHACRASETTQQYRRYIVGWCTSMYWVGEVTGYSNNTNIHNNKWGGVVADILEDVGAVFWQGSGILWDVYELSKVINNQLPYGVSWSTKNIWTVCYGTEGKWKEWIQQPNTNQTNLVTMESKSHLPTGEILPVNQNELL